MPDTTYLDWPFFDDRHRALSANLDAWAAREAASLADRETDLDETCRALVAALAQGGWLRYAVPAAHGGLHESFDVRSLCLIRETLARHGALADFAFAMQGLGSGAITLFGSDDLKRAYLPAVAKGEKIAAFALSEPDAGSDAAALTTTALDDGEAFVLNGVKTWVSNGGIADFYTVFARSGEAPGAKGISAFILDADTAGLAVAERIEVIAPHPLATVELKDCRVPKSQLLGAAGQGFKIAMATLDVFRATVGAAALGFARRALDEALTRATTRHLFDAPLSELQMTQAKLAEMALEVDAGALLVYRAAWTKDRGAARVTREAAMAKLYATEAAQRVVDAAVQIFGGLGVVSGHPVERLYREVRALRIYEGASEVQKVVIARQTLAAHAATGEGTPSRATGGSTIRSVNPTTMEPTMSDYTAHLDTFARDNLPPGDQWPAFNLDLPELAYPARMNCASELLDKMVAAGHGARPLLYTTSETWSYAELLARSNRIARVLIEDLGLVPGNRVLIRAANNPMFVACWFAIVKAGGIVVATMPLLRATELGAIIDKARVGLALCDERLAAELETAVALAPVCERICFFNGSGAPGAGAELEERMAGKPTDFTNLETAAEDTVLIAFTSGTTGKPKGTMHFHRDVMAICDCFPRSVLKPGAKDVFIGSPPLAFTFGLGGLVTFPMRVGAATVLLEAAPPAKLIEAIEHFKATICVTAPTAYRAMIDKASAYDLSSLRQCVAAGEHLPLPTFEAWREATGIKIINGIGTTEMLHIFISAAGDDIRPGATGKPIPGYQAVVVDDRMNPLPPGEVGRLAVRGPTGCRYLADERQTSYVVDGWNLTGDAYKTDREGYFWFQARTDDMIISSGYNISGPEVEEALMAHDLVQDCAVVASPDPERGNIVKAFVIPRPGNTGTPALVEALQDFVKQTIAPYKYPRAIVFVDSLPRTETGKVQRFKLRRMELEPAAEAAAG